MWELETGKLAFATPPGELAADVGANAGQPGVYKVAFSPGGDAFVSAAGGELRVWDAASGQEVASRRLARVIHHVGYSPDGKTIVVTSEGGDVRLWDARLATEPMVLAGHETAVRHAAFTPDGTYLATASFDNTVRLWSTASGELHAVYAGHRDRMLDVAFSPDGRRLTTASGDSTVEVWQVLPQLRASATAHPKWIGSITTSAARGYIVTTGDDDRLAVWDRRLHGLRSIAAPPGVSFNGANPSPDGSLLAVGRTDGVVDVLDATTLQRVRELRGHTGSVPEALFSHDGRSIVSASLDGSARIWEVGSGRPVQILPHGAAARMAAFSPDDAWVVVAGDGGWERWPVQPGAAATFKVSTTVDALSVEINASATRVLVALTDGSAALVDATTGMAVPPSFRGHFDTVAHAAFAHAERLVITSDTADTVRVWEASSGQLLEVHRSRRIEQTAQLERDLVLSDGGRLQVWRIDGEPDEAELRASLLCLPFELDDGNVRARTTPPDCASR
jgi:WD40 repeat protein